MGYRVDVKPVPQVQRNRAFDQILRSIWTSFGPQADPLRKPVNVNVDGKNLSAKGIHHHALGYLFCYSRQRSQEALGISVREMSQRRERSISKTLFKRTKYLEYLASLKLS